MPEDHVDQNVLASLAIKNKSVFNFNQYRRILNLSKGSIPRLLPTRGGGCRLEGLSSTHKHFHVALFYYCKQFSTHLRLNSSLMLKPNLTKSQVLNNLDHFDTQQLISQSPHQLINLLDTQQLARIDPTFLVTLLESSYSLGEVASETQILDR